MIPDHKALKARQRKERGNRSQGLALRTHRALSWLKCAEECEDVDGRFIFLWIAFNVAYSQEIGDQRRAKATANRALSRHDTRVVLAIVLDRMYTLRNQVMHGGATWNSRVNRDQLRDCAAFLGKLVPYVIQLMLDNLDTLWGAACYPVVEYP